MSKEKSKISLEFIKTAARILKTLGHPQRIKIVEYLDDGEKSVGQIQRELNLLQPIVSQHLKVMLDRGIVCYRQEGTRYFYSLANAFILKILSCMSDAQEMISKGEWTLEHHENN
ncbi:MAG: metalloregulator ArsR/SmtB family transcription factor [Candidatus Marinimicrobia bacterium]|jgi:DNA-binding transcriptional ArsR family regulator|nr:metalloregulator ArsR/SmtB family transcription factor [Candidatus Neomarinimicrobiota bacterium]|tara:strand:+ start:119 stop:463 length:345 start_codon:yes stop_codon:yes gene_type:complete